MLIQHFRSSAAASRSAPTDSQHKTPGFNFAIYTQPAAWLLAALFSLLPFFCVEVIPGTDLPQHLLQIYLLKDILSGAEGLSPDLRIQYFNPGNLIYWLGFPFAYILDGWQLAKLVAAFPFIAHWIVGWIYFRKRETALLLVFVSTLALYGPGMEWGLTNFQLGWPFFLAASCELTHTSKRTIAGGRLFVLAAATYGAHSLWFAVLCITAAIQLPFMRHHWRQAIKIILALLPPGLLGILWITNLVGFRQASFTLIPYWFVSPWQKLTGLDMLLQLPFQLWQGASILALTALLLLSRQSWRSLTPFQLQLLKSALLLYVLYVLLPDKFLNSILFSLRWLPFALALGMLSFDLERTSTATKTFIAGVAIGAMIALAKGWHDTEKTELDGFKSAAEAATPGGRLLGLDYIKHSSTLVRPYLQIFAYTSIKGVREFSFSFIEHGSSIVTADPPRKIHWTPGLEWFAERFVDEDFDYFSQILVNAKGDELTRFDQRNDFERCSPPARWQLYCRIKQNGSAEENRQYDKDSVQPY